MYTQCVGCVFFSSISLIRQCTSLLQQSIQPRPKVQRFVMMVAIINTSLVVQSSPIAQSPLMQTAEDKWPVSNTVYILRPYIHCTIWLHVYTRTAAQCDSQWRTQRLASSYAQFSCQHSRSSPTTHSKTLTLSSEAMYNK